jgi:multiple RNA-binding domain-containing protein 1
MSSSRIIVKNLPKEITKEQLKEHFSKCGQVTDVRMVLTPTGLFRRFAFIGYTLSSSAISAVDYFNKSYIDNCRIEVGVARAFGDKELPRPWSKHSSTHQEPRLPQDKKEEKKSQLTTLVDEYYQLSRDDPKFNEYLSSYSGTWDDGKGTMATNIQEAGGEEEEVKGGLSDKDYLLSKVVQSLDEEDAPLYTLRMRGLPYMVTVRDVKKFFSPVQPANVRLLEDSNGKCTGLGFVDFFTMEDVDEAMKYDKKKMGKRYVELFRDERESRKDKKKNWGDTDHRKLISESGRLFIRNLSYSTSEEDLIDLFEKYGELSETCILVNRETNVSIGLAYVTYMFPEHGVKAYDGLDGQIFQGRLLHILAADPPREKTEITQSEGTSFKNEKKEKLKSQTGNWNSLFLGSNAVADGMAVSYDVSKGGVLDHETRQSLAVRLAMGETKLVKETKEFLESNGVDLDVFEREGEAVKRSKTVILVKNLPWGTTEAELRDVFDGCGSLVRVIAPPLGVSALVEFRSPSGAKRAFKRLAYSQFKNLPLYLEWAPIGALKEDETKSIENESQENIAESMDDKPLKILVRNVPFEATRKEIKKLFGAFGEIKSVRLPQKMTDGGNHNTNHRGFGFVEYVNPDNAQSAMDSLRDSTHLYGRRLVLEWAETGENIDKMRKRTIDHLVESTGEVKMKRSKKLIEELLLND